jgi:hypothetical protein
MAPKWLHCLCSRAKGEASIFAPLLAWRGVCVCVCVCVCWGAGALLPSLPPSKPTLSLLPSTLLSQALCCHLLLQNLQKFPESSASYHAHHNPLA